ncbi:hypothetical protein S58_71530 [Bradyrhizobium oligotrophicum S58]|uniref:Uncharacterized protein n=1 Tax=Bradyrhizobium oligotrophicum S58 TaxID=1245469 RepID=M4ZH47_9BRAD|nr:hypothetical protein [Bradyrhizobium oligotrophicum]BAM93118.1 hypothetical protein S58_71530 [Bradyrhizobium oligotrophicum S58]
MLALIRRLSAVLKRRYAIEPKAASSEPGRRWRFRAVRVGGRSIELWNQGIFDELVVDDWLHIEQMDDKVYWLQVGDVCIWVTVAAGEKPVVDVQRGAYGEVRGDTRAWSVEDFKRGLSSQADVIAKLGAAER